MLEEEEGGRLLNGAGQTAVDIHGLRKVQPWHSATLLRVLVGAPL